MLPATNVVPFCDPNSFDIDCIFGVDIGRDRTNNFMLGFDGTTLRLAIRASDDRFVIPVLRDGIAQLIDVTCLKFGIDPCVFRLPVLDVNPGDLIVTADSPFSVLFVVYTDEAGIRGVVPGRQELVRYLPPKNLFGSQFYVKVFSLFGGFGGNGGGLFGGGGDAAGLGALLPFLLCCRDLDGIKDDKFLYALLLSQSFGGGMKSAGGGGANPLLPLLLLSGGKSDSSLALLLAASGGQLFGQQVGMSTQEAAEEVQRRAEEVRQRAEEERRRAQAGEGSSLHRETAGASKRRQR